MNTRSDLHYKIEQTISFHGKDSFVVPIVSAILVFVLLLLFQPFEYRSYGISKVFGDSLLTGVLVLITMSMTRFLAKILIRNRVNNPKTVVIIMGLDITTFLILSFMLNLVSGGFENMSYVWWLVSSLKYIVIFMILLIPLSLFTKQYILLDLAVKGKSLLLFPEQELKHPIAASNKVRLSTEKEKIQLDVYPNDLLIIKSCGNYIEVFYLKGEKVCSAILRNTLTSICFKVTKYPFLFKCHRSYLININRIHSTKGNARGCEVTLKGISDKIPVSRSNISAFNTILKIGLK